MENSGGREFTATTRVTGNITVYARWKSSNASLADLSVSAGTLNPSFVPYITEYSVTVPNNVASISVSATPTDGNARYTRYPSGNSVNLNTGLNTIIVKVIAEDGTTSRDYTIAVTKEPLSGNANLDSLGVSVGALSPAFSSNTPNYTVSVPAGTAAITISAAAVDALNATVTQSPGTLGSPVALSASTTNITLTVKALNGNTKNYTITVYKGTGNNAVNVSIGITDKYIDLARNTENDLSQALSNTLRLTVPYDPDGYGSYTWLVDGSDFANATQEITLSGVGRSLGTHSVLLKFVKDGVTYSCEVQFRVVR
jgi:hypothetical protein